MEYMRELHKESVDGPDKGWGVLICGDLNVTADDRDNGDWREEKPYKPGITLTERESLRKLMEATKTKDAF